MASLASSSSLPDQEAGVVLPGLTGQRTVHRLGARLRQEHAIVQEATRILHVSLKLPRLGRGVEQP